MNSDNAWWGEKWKSSFFKFNNHDNNTKFNINTNNFLISNINFKGNQVFSRIKTKSGKSYNQIFKFRNITEPEKKIIINIIEKNPLYLSKLLNKIFPKEFHKILNKNNINLFENSHSNFNTACTCSDISYLCKHINAVINLLSLEINKNPFLLFQIYNLDILKELENFRIINNNKNKDFFSLKNIADNSKKIIDTDNNCISVESLESLDLSELTDFDENILKLLNNNPLFYKQGNFKHRLKNIYINTKLKTGNILHGYEKIHDYKYYIDFFDFNLEDFKYFDSIIINKDYNFKLTFNDNINKGNTDKSALISLMNLFNTKNSTHIKNYSKKLYLLYQVYNISLIFLQKGIFIPQLIKLDSNLYKIRWIPPLTLDKIKKIINKIEINLPVNFIKFENNFNEKKKYIYPEKKEQVLILFSIFFGLLIEIFNNRILKNNLITNLFFKNKKLNTNKFFELKEIPNNINLWLNRFYITHKDFIPIIKIDLLNDKYILDILIELKNNELNAPINISNIFKSNEYNDIRQIILKDLYMISEYLPEIKKIINSKGLQTIEINPNYFAEIFYNVIPAIKLLGIKILLPQNLHKIIKPKITLSIDKKNKINPLINYMSLADVLSFEWKIALGNEILSKNEFLNIVRGLNGIVSIKNKFILLDEKNIREILKHFTGTPKLNNHDLLKMGFDENYNGAKIEITENAKNLYNLFRKKINITIPKNLNAVLRNYQLRGFKWIYKNVKMGFGCLIADDMGLGKTIQTITLLLKLKEENIIGDRKCIIIVPTALLTNWNKEIEKFAPSLKILTYHGKKRNIKNNYDVLLTTYGIIRNDFNLFKNTNWFLTILDEAQNIKNPNSTQTKYIKKITSDIKLAITGTPVENRLLEIWSIFDFINKGYLGSMQYFKKEFAIPIELLKNNDKLDTFKKITSPFILRRVKTDKSIINDLPEKIEILEYCYLTPQQTAIYQNIVNKSLNKIEESSGIERKGLILKLMVSLKQICNHPTQYLKHKDINPNKSGKTMMLINLLKKIYLNNQKVLIFTQYREMGEILKNIIITKFKTIPLFMHGSLDRKSRDKVVDSFQNDNNINTLILTLKAGGTGLNLTAATNVIHFDLWWNPAIENQATDRAYRIGQRNDVIVYRLLTQGTLEEKINNMITNKKELAKLAVSKGDLMISELSNEQLKIITSLN